MRAEAGAVVIGGGVAGCSIAYHLARLGFTDVVVVEQHELTEGTTWHSAGFVGQLRSTISQTRMIMYSSSLYAELRERTGLDPGWRGVGGLRLATTEPRVSELLRQVSSATTYGLEMVMLSPAETADSLPLLDVRDVLAAGWLPGDGFLRPEALTRALAAGAAAMGVEFVTATTVTGIDVVDGRVRGVRTDAGPIRADIVVNAGGAAAGHLGRLAGVDLPIVPIRHQYVVTGPPGTDPRATVSEAPSLDAPSVDSPSVDSLSLDAPSLDAIPTVRDPDHIVYFRGEGDGILVGGYLRTPQAWWPADGAAPLSQPRSLFEPDLAAFAEPWEAVRRRVPSLVATPVAKVVHGPEAFTPDGEFLLGETAVRGFWVAAGFCVHGLAAAGGVGKVIAEWIVDGTPEFDVSHMDIRRFGAHAGSRSWATAKALEAYSRYYDIVYPGEEWSAARPLRRSPTWPRFCELDAAFGEKSGWERANWFGVNATAGGAADEGGADEGGGGGERPAGWAGRVWSPAIGVEVRATTEAAGLYDQSSFAKFDVRGTGVVSFLQRVCANDVDKSIGALTYTQLLNARAGIEADLTVTRLGETHFRVVTSTASGVRDAAWLRRHAPDTVTVDDVTGAYGCLCLWGPAAREILAPLAEAPLDFGFMRARRFSVGSVPVLAQRVTFVGEYGWELYAPTEYVLTLWDSLVAAGTPLGLRPAGYRAMDAMRLEKGYRVWGSDLTTDTTPDEAGLSFAVRVDKDFIGRDALLAARDDPGPARRLRCLTLADRSTVCIGTEPVRVDGRHCGRVTSGGYGYRVGESIAYAYLPSTVEVGALVEVGVFGTWCAATVREEPLFDPGNNRVRG